MELSAILVSISKEKDWILCIESSVSHSKLEHCSLNEFQLALVSFQQGNMSSGQGVLGVRRIGK